MVKRILAIIFALLIALSLASYAESGYDFSSHVIDDSDVLSLEEEQKLIERISEFSEKYNVALYLANTESLDLSDTDSYCENLIKNSKYSFDEKKSYAIIILNFKKNKINIECQGRMLGFIDEKLQPYIFGAINDKIKISYYKAYDEFINISEKFIKGDIFEEQREYKHKDVDFNRYVIDNANLMDEERKKELAVAIEQVAKRHDIALVVASSNDVPRGKHVSFSDDLYEYGKFGFDTQDSGALFLIDMKNRMMHISTKGNMIDIINDNRENYIFDAVAPYMKSKDYGKAFELFVSMANDYINRGPEAGTYRYEEKAENNISDVDVVVAVVGGIITLLIFYFSVARKYEFKNKAYIYDPFDNSKLELRVKEDSFIRREQHRTRIERSSSSGGGGRSGGSGTHRSSSGRTYGGGSRGF